VNTTDQEYQRLLRDLGTRGTALLTRNDRVKRLVAWPVTFYATPLVSVRKTAWRNALREWEWFMAGSNDVNDLHPAVRPWWQPWADGVGEVTFNYGVQFRHFGEEGFDQIEHLIAGIRDHPNSRRNVVTTWNPVDMADSRCPITNCHGTVIQAFVERAGLTLVTYQRSADVVCGVPHNWVAYWAFLLWLSHRTGHRPHALTWIGGDVHLYQEHDAIAADILKAPPDLAPPEMVYMPTGSEFKADDFALDRAYLPVVTTKARMVV
jgi:thymidylate synthase